MITYILINLTTSNDNQVLGVYDSELLAENRKLYFEGVYKNDALKIVKKYMEYLDRD